MTIVLGYYAIYGVSENRVVDYSEARQLFVQERVRSFWVYDTVLTMETRTTDGGTTKVEADLYSAELFWADLGDLIREQQEAGIIVSYQLDPPYEPSWLVELLFYGLIILIIFFLWQLIASRGQGGADRGARFGKARIRFQPPGIPGLFRELLPRGLQLPQGIGLLHLLHHLEKTGTPRNTKTLEAWGHCQADGLLGAAGIRHHQIGGQGIQPAFNALHRGIEGLQINGDIIFLLHPSLLWFRKN